MHLNNIDNIDKPFAIYALALTFGTISVISFAIIGSGGSFPPTAFILEHLAMSLTFRAAYKSLDGRDYAGPILKFLGMIVPEQLENTKIRGAAAEAA